MDEFMEEKTRGEKNLKQIQALQTGAETFNTR